MLRPLPLLLLLLLAAAALWAPRGTRGVKVPLSRGDAAPPRVPWERWTLEKPVESFRIEGQRVPRRYFMVSGFGETDQGSGTQPWETGAHDLAMEAAGIHNTNLMTYTSILPPEAEEISDEEAQKYLHHGAVLECILAEQHAARGDRATAGVGRMMVMDRSEGKNSKPMGGFAVEYEGGGTEEFARAQLDTALDGLFDRRFTQDSHQKQVKQFTVTSSEVTKAFGTALAGLCFVDYLVPVFASDIHPPHHLRHDAHHAAGELCCAAASEDMHPPLHISKHPHCKERIEALVKCHADHPWAKYWNVCATQKILLDNCFREEKAINRARNFEKSKRERERLRVRLEEQRAEKQQQQQEAGQQQPEAQQQQQGGGSVPGYFTPHK